MQLALLVRRGWHPWSRGDTLEQDLYVHAQMRTFHIPAEILS